jgi:hypothetical protein
MREQVRSRRRAILVATAALWIALLVLGFVAQVTKLFGAHGDAVTLGLLGLAAAGFILMGAAGMWLVMRGFDRPDG